ncbi:MAG: ComEA family DNA-binding protein [Anaerolineales bacterium]|nr:ComEA family DNA-binding protein [Anaerolineales bacterium]
MKSWWQVALGILLGMLGAGAILLSSQPPRGSAIALLPPPTPAPLMIHVSGAVNQPGVYALAAGSRVVEAIDKAGGFRPDADQNALNLAGQLQDGERLFVPIKPTVQPTASITNLLPASGPTLPPATTAAGLININTASQEQLESLPGIGPVTAQKIITYRQENGPFTSIDAIQLVSGIGPVTFEKIQALITIQVLP